MALATATLVFAQIQKPLAHRRRAAHQTTTLAKERRWVEQAVAAAAAAQHTPPGALIPPDHWIPHLNPSASPTLRSTGQDATGRPFGPQIADQPSAP
ncbi:MAG: hypothetical protein ACKV19_11880 [Verrucomicrobiales bacterium]